MKTAKKIIGSIIEETGEFVRDSARQVAETVDPVKLMEQAAGIKKQESEFSKYLKGLGGSITEAELEKRKKEFAEKQEKDMEEAKSIINKAIPDHLKPIKETEPSDYEKKMQEEEMKKAQAVEAQKTQQKQAMIVPAGQQKGVLGGKKKKPLSSAFESAKNIKVG